MCITDGDRIQDFALQCVDFLRHNFLLRGSFAKGNIQFAGDITVLLSVMANFVPPSLSDLEKMLKDISDMAKLVHQILALYILRS